MRSKLAAMVERSFAVEGDVTKESTFKADVKQHLELTRREEIKTVAKRNHWE